jgi:hypothetical protein
MQVFYRFGVGVQGSVGMFRPPASLLSQPDNLLIASPLRLVATLDPTVLSSKRRAAGVRSLGSRRGVMDGGSMACFLLGVCPFSATLAFSDCEAETDNRWATASLALGFGI